MSLVDLFSGPSKLLTMVSVCVLQMLKLSDALKGVCPGVSAFGLLVFLVPFLAASLYLNVLVIMQLDEVRHRVSYLSGVLSVPVCCSGV